MLVFVLAERRSFAGRVAGCIGHRIGKWSGTVADIVAAVVVVVGKRLGNLAGIVVELAAGVELVERRRIGKLKHTSSGIEQLAVAGKHSFAHMSSGNLGHTVAAGIAERIHMCLVV